jgi:hypothetical protein
VGEVLAKPLRLLSAKYESPSRVIMIKSSKLNTYATICVVNTTRRRRAAVKRRRVARAREAIESVREVPLRFFACCAISPALSEYTIVLLLCAHSPLCLANQQTTHQTY